MAPRSLLTRIRVAWVFVADAVRLALRTPGTRQKLRILGLAARSFLSVASRQPGLLGRIFRAPPLREYELRPGPDAPVLRLRSNDMVVMEVYGGRPYELDYSPIGPVRSVLDIGANVGAASAFLAARFPEAKIVAVEPNPFTFELLEENLRRVAPGGIAINAAIVPSPGRYRLEAGTSPSNDKVIPADGASADGRLGTLTMNELLDKHLHDGVDLVKLDIEGGERALLERAVEWAPRVGALVAETHEPLTPERATELLMDAGFEPLPLPDRIATRDIVFCRRRRG